MNTIDLNMEVVPVPPVAGEKDTITKKMKNFTSVKDVPDVKKLIQKGLEVKKNPLKEMYLGKNKTLALLFMNPSLRTRMSTQKAAFNLGMNVMIINFNAESWQLELEDGTVMNLSSQEHIKDAAKMLSLYCDIIGIRTFPKLTNKTEDQKDVLLMQLLKYADVPVVSMESAMLHPLQSLADMITMEEMKMLRKPKVVLTWAPHPKAVPQVVANSFAEWMEFSNADFVIAHPEGFELDEQFTQHARICYDQDEALQDADFVYVKSWSSSENYGVSTNDFKDWMVTESKMKLTDNAYFMHCLPIRRNVEATDQVIDHPYSLVYQQANNRIYAAQAVLSTLLQDGNN